MGRSNWFQKIQAEALPARRQKHLEALHAEWNSLPARRAARLQELERDRFKQQLEKYLENFFIEHVVGERQLDRIPLWVPLRLSPYAQSAADRCSMTSSPTPDLRPVGKLELQCTQSRSRTNTESEKSSECDLFDLVVVGRQET